MLDATIEAFHMIEVTLTEIVVSLGLALNASYNVIFSQDWAESFQPLHHPLISILLKFVTISILIR